MDGMEKLKKEQPAQHMSVKEQQEQSEAGAAPVEAVQAAQETMQEALQLTEVLPMREQPIPQVLQRAAAPMPEQPVPPGDMTFKERCKQKRRDWSAKRKSPYADHVSLAIKEHMDEVDAERAASKPAEAKIEADRQGRDIDARVLHSFVTGYKADENGNPVNEQEAEKMRNDQQFLADYCSENLERRLPHLERIKNEMLNLRLTEDMLTETYIERHTSEMFDIIAKLTYFENIYSDEINAPYFDNIPEVEKKLLQYRWGDICAVFVNMWIVVLGKKGMTISGSCITFEKDKAFYEPLAMQEDFLRGQLRESLQKSEEDQAALREEVLMQQKQDRVADFNEAVLHSMPEAALDKAIGSEEDYENLKALFLTKTHEVRYNDEIVQYEGVVAYSDAEYLKGGESRALQAFGIRESSKETAKADKKLRGEFFSDIPANYKTMFRNLSDAGVDFEKMRSQFTRKSCGMGAYVSGGGIEKVHDQMLALFEKYVMAPQGQDYVRKMVSMLKDAKVFENSREKCVEYILQCLLNSFGANFSQVAADGDYYGDQSEAAVNVCRESCRNLLSLPRMNQMNAEARKELPPELVKLTDNYRQLVNRLADAVK